MANNPKALSRLNNPAAGIGFMCLGALFMVGLDVTVRFLLQVYPLAQAVGLRSAFSLILLTLIVAGKREFHVLKTRRPAWHVVRSLLMAGSMFTFFYALRYVALTEVIVIAFAAPLIVTALSQPFLGESVGPWRWGAVIVGFIGVVIVVRPGFGIIHPAALLALAGAAFYACIALTSRKLSTTESTWALSWYSFIAPALIAGVISLFIGNWVQPDLIGWIQFMLSGVFGGCAFLCINAAYGRAPAAIVVPFEYTGLIWAATAGYVFWREIPSVFTWIGAAIIVGSGVVILYRETMTGSDTDSALIFPLQDAAVGNPEQVRD